MRTIAPPHPGGSWNVHDDVAVGESDDQAVLGRIVLVLGLGDKALASVVVGLARLSALVLGLEAAVEIISILGLSSCCFKGCFD